MTGGKSFGSEIYIISNLFEVAIPSSFVAGNLRNVVSTGTRLPYENGILTRKFSTSFPNTASFRSLK